MTRRAVVSMMIGGLALVSCTNSSVSTSSTRELTPSTSDRTTTIVPPATTPAAPGADALADLPGLLAILGDDDEIFVMRPDGSSLVMVAGPTRDVVARSQPTWSPSGTEIAWTERSADESYEFVIATATGDEVVRVPSPVFAQYIAWSPTVTHLAMMGNDPSGAFVVAMVDRAGPISEVATGAPAYIDWAPDGDGLLVHVEDRFEFVPVVGERIVIPTRGDFRVGLFIGNGLLYGVDAGVGEVLVVARDPSDQPIGIMRYAAPTAWVLHPDGDRLAVLGRGSAQSQAVLDTDDGVLATLGPARLEILALAERTFESVFEGQVVAFVWSPDGSTLLYLTQVGDGTGRLTWHTYRTGTSVEHAAFTPTGAFARSNLAFFDQFARSVNYWSPDSAAFTYAGGSTDASGIWVQLVDGSEPVRVASGQVAAWSADASVQAMKRPPLTVTTWPVIYADSSEARNIIHRTMSSTSP